MITQSQATTLAAVLHEMRPRWAVASMMKIFEKQAGHVASFADIALAAVTAARDPVAETPGIIFIDQRFWPEAVRARLPKPPDCEDHTGERAHNCSSCWADIKVGDRPPTHIGRHWQPTPEQSEALADAGASLIPTEES